MTDGTTNGMMYLSGHLTNDLTPLQRGQPMHGSYSHLRFARHWKVSPKAQYELGQCDAIVAAICEMPLRPEHHAQLLQVSLIKGAQATTAIEGNTLSEDEIQRVVEGQSLPPSKEYQEIEVRNILNAMNSLLTLVAINNQENLLTPELILRFHSMIGQGLGEHFDAIPGRFRKDHRVVGPYRCPDPRDVPELVETLCRWLRTEFRYARGDQPFADAVIQAIVTHVYIEWIHPFGDGNGRTGRLLEFYILFRAGNPDIASHTLSNFYNLTRPEYYRQLQNAHDTRDLTEFIEYAVEGLRDGLMETLKVIQSSQFATAWRSYIHDRFAARKYTKKTVFKRRRDLMLYFPIEGWFTLEQVSLLNPEIAKTYGQLSERTLKRDLDVLVEMELVRERDGHYAANTNALRLMMARRLKRDTEPSSIEVGSTG